MEGTVKWRQGGWRWGESDRDSRHSARVLIACRIGQQQPSLNNNSSNMPHTQQAPVNKDPAGGEHQQQCQHAPRTRQAPVHIDPAVEATACCSTGGNQARRHHATALCWGPWGVLDPVPAVTGEPGEPGLGAPSLPAPHQSRPRPCLTSSAKAKARTPTATTCQCTHRQRDTSAGVTARQVTAEQQAQQARRAGPLTMGLAPTIG